MANNGNIINQGDKNPWKGLNFYVEGEILYGRDAEIQRLAQFIVNNSQTVLYGKSGIGKSSIINAGIFPEARSSGLFPVPMRLGHNHQSNTSYLEQIKVAFKESGIGINPLCDAIDKENESLWEFFHRHTFFQPETGNAVRPLVVLDQFEEIFTLQHSEAVKKEFFSQLADLINEVKPRYIFDAQHNSDSSNGSNDTTTLQDLRDFVQTIGNESPQSNYVEESNFNLVFVLREDYLSYFERYTAYIPAMKSNRFPLLPINEEQAAEIIMKPCPGLISKQVAELIIQKITETTDFALDGIPEIEVDATMLSLFLSRLYLKKGAQTTITAEMVNEFGDFIIKDFYEESVADLPEDDIEKLEDALITIDGRRDNDSYSNLTEGKHISARTIDKLVKDSKLLREFYYQGDRRLEFMHDTLCPIINDRIAQREQAKEQEAERQRLEAEKAKIRQEEELKRKAIERQAEQERLRHGQETLALKKRNRRRIKWLVFAAAFLALILAAAFIRHQLLYAPYSCYYANFTTLNGWPIGLEEIDPNDKAVQDSLIVYYRLTRFGRLNKNKFQKVEVISAHDHKPTTNIFIESPAVGLWYAELGTDSRAKAFAELQKQTSYWIYSATEQESGTAGKCTAFGLDGKELYSVQFNRDNTTAGADKNKYVQWAVYYDASGKQMIINDNGIDRMRQTIDNGTVTGCLFFSMLGVPQKNERGAYGYQYEINDTTHLLSKAYRVDKFGNKLTDAPITYLEHQYGRPKKTSLYEVIYPQPGMIVRRYQSYNDTLAFYPEGKPKFGSLHPDFTRSDSIISYSYDNLGRLAFTSLSSRGRTVNSAAYTYLEGAKTKKYKEILITKNGNSYTERYQYPDTSTTIVEFWQDKARICRSQLNEKGDLLYYHRCTELTRHDSNTKFIVETKEYRDTAGLLIKPTIADDGNDLNEYSKLEVFRDEASKNILLEYYYNEANEICRSELFEYDDYGNVITIAVAGIDGTAVRCPDWNKNGLCCYKMSILKPFYSGSSIVYSSAHGVNEFNENSLIMGYDQEDNPCTLTIDEQPMDYLLTRGRGDNSILTNLQLSVTSTAQIDKRFSASFIHVLSQKGTFYKAGLKDGDIIIRIDGNRADSYMAKRLENDGSCQLDVARANPESNNYIIRHFTVPAGNPLIHVHHAALTKEEFDRLNKSIQL